ncbi:NACHT domain-containing protein [Streptosporangium vulgare]|uniref:NACHT domain-containing protein n=1 Tax=Streptosporangium vulgare TaxID=46190 RepID=A0ABV5TRD1_9ACTN
MRRGRGKAWLWGALGLATLAAAAVMIPRLLPELKTGDVDPLGALIGSVSLATTVIFGVASLYLAYRALHPPPTPAEAVSDLAQEVKRTETIARRQLLGDHDKTIDVAFTLWPAPGHPAAPRPSPQGAAAAGRLGQVTGYYRALFPRRLVITGAPGAGKTVLAVDLILGLLEDRAEGEAVPVRLSAASLITETADAAAVEKWLIGHLTEVYRLKKAIARVLVDERLVLPVIDGLDEMDSEGALGYDSRAGRVLRALNAYQDGRAKAAVVLTCRTTHYQDLEELRVWARDTARVELSPVEAAGARDFLAARAEDPSRWEPVLAAIAGDPGGPLAQGLSTPWRLTLAAAVYDQRDRSGAFVRDPGDLVDLADWTTPEEVRDHLLGLLLPATLALHPALGGADAARVHRWLTHIARHLERQAREVGMSPVDIVPHLIWPIGGRYLPQLLQFIATAGLFLIAMAIWLVPAPPPEQDLFEGREEPFLVIGVLAGFCWIGVTALWRGEPAIWGRNRLAWYRSGFWWLIGVIITSFMALRFLSGVAADVAAWAFLLSIPMAVVMMLEDYTDRGRWHAGADLATPHEAVHADLLWGLLRGAILGLILGLLALPGAGVVQGLMPGVFAGVAFGLTLRPGGARYVCGLASAALRGRLPWRFAAFCRWACGAGLLRIAGVAYQFRHRELQDYLARSPAPQP